MIAFPLILLASAGFIVLPAAGNTAFVDAYAAQAEKADAAIHRAVETVRDR